MNKKVKTIINVFLILIVLSSIFLNVAVFAANGAPNPTKFKGSSNADTSGIEKIGNQVITIVSTIGSVASVIVLIVLGLKYMMGSAEEKAEYKKTLMPYVIGAGMVFAASAIAGVIYQFTKNVAS